MDVDNPKVYGDTYITALMVLFKNNVPLAVLVVVPLRFGIIMAD